MVWLSVISVLLLGYLAYSDFTTKSIPVWGVVLAFVVSMFSMLLHRLELYWGNTLLTTMAAVLQFSMLLLWFRIKKRAIRFFDHLFGWGDVAMLAVGIIHFSVFPFMCWIVVVSLTGLVGYAIRKKITQSDKTHLIPLAGWMAIWLIPVQVVYYFDSSWYYFNPLLIP